MDEKRIVYPDFSGEMPPPRISTDEIHKRIGNEIKYWDLIESPLPENPMKNKRELHRVFIFKSFDHVVDYLVDLKPICDIIPHHPRIENIWKTLNVYLSTWALDYDISYKDIQLAMNMDKLYFSKYQTESAVKKSQETNVFQKALKDLISQNKIQEVIDEIKNFYLLNRNRPMPNELINLSGSFIDLKAKEITGEISNSEGMQYSSKIRNSLLKIIENLNE